MHIQKWENSQAEQGPEIEIRLDLTEAEAVFDWLSQSQQDYLAYTFKKTGRGFEKQLLEKLFQILQETKND